MKKRFFLLFLAASLVLVSCDNFMNGSAVQDQLDKMIDVANATSCTIVVSNDTTMGSFLSTGDKSCKLGYSIDVQYSVKKDQYIFKGLKAVDKNDNTQSLNDYVEFESIDSDDARGIYKVSIKLIKESNDILIVPECELVPGITTLEPEYDSLGCEQDTTIRIKFNKSIKLITSIEDINLALSITDSKGENLIQYFDTPYFNDDSTILYIPTQKQKLLLENTTDKKDIIVKFDLSFIKDESGYSGSGTYQGKYRINGTRDSVPPVLTSVNLYSSDNPDDKYYKKLSEKTFSEWGNSATDKTEYLANHINDSVYAELKGSDTGSGIARAHIYEKLIRYSDGTTPDTQQVIDSPVEFIQITEDGTYCLKYEMKSAMDGIIELEFYLEDYADNKCEAANAKKFYVLKDTLVESNRINFDQEVSQLELSTESWLPEISVISGNTQNVKLTLSTDVKDDFYANCSSDYIIEAYWGYNKETITNSVTIDKEKGEYTFTRDVNKIVYIKLVVSDEIGNTKEIIKTMDPRPELNDFVWEISGNNGFMAPPLKIQGLNSLKILANRNVSDDEKTYVRYIVYIYNGEEATGEPEKKMYLPSGEEVITTINTNQNMRYGDHLNNWFYVNNLNNNQVPLNKLIRVYAATFCGDFISPMTTAYVEFELTRWDEPSSFQLSYIDWESGSQITRVEFAEGKSPKSSQGQGTASVGYENLKTELGPYVKETIKVTTTEIKNSGTAKIVIDDYKTDAAITEGNVKYEFYIVERTPEIIDPSVTQITPDENCRTDQIFKNNEPEFYIPAQNYYKIFIRATGKQGDYLSLDLGLNTESLSDEEIRELKMNSGSQPGLNFYLNGATQVKNRIEFTGDVTPPEIKVEPDPDPFFYCTPGYISIPFPRDETGLYKNKKGNYVLTYYLIPASGNRLQQGLTYTAEELKENYKRYEKTLEFEPRNNASGYEEQLPIVIPTGNEKSGVYNLSVVCEDTSHNSSVLTMPCINRILGDLDYEFGNYEGQRIVATGNPDPYNPYNGGGDPYNGGMDPNDPNYGGIDPNDPNNGGVDPNDPYNGGMDPNDPYNGGMDPNDPNNGGVDPNDPYNGGMDPNDPNNNNSENGNYTIEPYCYYGMEFNLENDDQVDLYFLASSPDNSQYCHDGTYTKDMNNIKEFSESDYNKWYKLCGYKNSDSAIEMGFYNIEYFFLKPESYYFVCNSKNALPGLNGIQIFYDKPIFVHTMFFKDFIPDDIDKTNYKDWERRGAETGIFLGTPPVSQDNDPNNPNPYSGNPNVVNYTATSTTYSFSTNLKGVPYGSYYTTIIHFADGEVVMTDIKYKE